MIGDLTVIYGIDIILAFRRGRRLAWWARWDGEFRLVHRGGNGTCSHELFRECYCTMSTHLIGKRERTFPSCFSCSSGSDASVPVCVVIHARRTFPLVHAYFLFIHAQSPSSGFAGSRVGSNHISDGQSGYVTVARGTMC